MMLRKIISLILTFVLITSFFVHATVSDWAKDEIAEALEKGFVPESLQSDYTMDITREEFAHLAVSFVANTLGYSLDEFVSYYSEPHKKLSPSGETETVSAKSFSFSDTENIYVNLAGKCGMILGNGDGTFLPKNNITRQEAAVMLFRTFCSYNYSGGYMWSDVNFNDKDKISDWAYFGVSFALGHGIMKGISDSEFDPEGTYTREQAIATFLRMGKSDDWKNHTEKAVFSLNPKLKTRDYAVNELLSTEWYKLIERIDSKYGVVLYMHTAGIPHSPDYFIRFINNEGKSFNLSEKIPTQSGFGSKPEHKNIKLSEDETKITFEITLEGSSEPVFFEADLTTGNCIVLNKKSN